MIDSHAHITSPEMLPEIENVMERAKVAGVEKVINICTDAASLEAGLVAAKKHKGLFNTAATTPHDVEEEGESFFPIVEKAAENLVAIGETGLDYFYEHSPKKLQQLYLEKYFALACQVDLPIIFHCREAFDDLFAMADEMYEGRSAVLHCFTGTKDEAKRCLDRGWMISFSGIITFKKSVELREVVSYVPLEHIFVETDSPYLAPQSKRGKPNEPAFVVEVAEKVAEVKELPISEIEKVTSENISRFFQL
ncbi:MAG: TatD family hydrolase [Simkaniaceae bacterium]|nr:TatD family hydrolase [Candidatus Sacchlamyda saccharinae]